MVIASRYLVDTKCKDDDIVTSFGNWLFTRTVNLLLGGFYIDILVIDRACRKTMAQERSLDLADAHSLTKNLFRTKISWELLLSIRATAILKITEIPGDELPRIGGEKKLQVLKWGATYYFLSIRELWFWRGH